MKYEPLRRFGSYVVGAAVGLYLGPVYAAQLDAGVVELASSVGLQARDADGDGIADAYYSSMLNLTWLADANYANTTGFTPYGALNRSGAESWVKDISLWGVSGWRLPSIINSAAVLDCYGYRNVESPQACAAPLSPDSSELANFYTNVRMAGASSLFQNIEQRYWESNPTKTILVDFEGGQYPFEVPSAYSLSGMDWAFDIYYGQNQLISTKPDVGAYVWLVHDGDVLNSSVVPEPGTFVLMGVGIAALGFATKRRRFE